MEIRETPIEDLVPYARNARMHSDEQVAQIAASVREFGFNDPVAVDGDQGIIEGHGRVLAARKLGIEKVPTIELSHLTDIQKRAYILAHNKLTENAGWDLGMLAVEMEELQAAGLDDLTGFSAGEVEGEAGATNSGTSDVDSTYTRKIVAPVYEPKGECPDIKDLVDTEKTNSLLNEINNIDLSEEVADFLRLAAERHTSFHFARIAEFYCHADPQVQDLMEKSGLVIIDFKKAIEYGFVQMTERLGKLADIEESENDA